MQARAEQLGATLRVTSQPGEGARVLATLPILDSAPP
jgi:signal transduction histidine kinase